MDVTSTALKVKFSSGRSHTFQLKGRVPYVRPGDTFAANTEFLGGLPRKRQSFEDAEQKDWNPQALLSSQSIVDRYSGVKALGAVGTESDVPALTGIMRGRGRTSDCSRGGGVVNSSWRGAGLRLSRPSH